MVQVIQGENQGWDMGGGGQEREREMGRMLK